MPLNQMPNSLFIYLIGFAGLFAGGIATYIANVLLLDEGFSWPSQLAKPLVKPCRHKDNIFAMIPFVSLFLLENRCKNCQLRAKWQYPAVEIIMALVFCFLVYRFGLNFYSFGMMLFIFVLLTICITDFRAKIIPHEITYPAILVGIIFSALIRADIFGALAGIGVSYIFFDFLAFYGLKIYLLLNPPTLNSIQTFVSVDRGKATQLSKISSWFSKEPMLAAKGVKKKEIVSTQLYSKGVPLEELEVIGGGDAVLSALISAWLGWQKLILSLLFGFLAGTIIGAIYVLFELRKERLLKIIIKPVIISIFGVMFLAICMLFMLAATLRESIFSMPYHYILPSAALIGLLLGVIVAGSKISKPFPFGPALAIGAVVAIFRHE